jgi:transcriptional regulator with XRE-family HTH domain
LQQKNTEKLWNFSERLRTLAKRNNLAQIDIARNLKLPPSRIGNWFQGKNFPKPQDQIKLAKLLKTSVEYLIHGQQNTGKNTENVDNSVYQHYPPQNQDNTTITNEDPSDYQATLEYVIDKWPLTALIDRIEEILLDETKTPEECIKACKILLPLIKKRLVRNPDKN